MDLTIRGQLPPSSGRKRPSTNSQRTRLYSGKLEQKWNSTSHHRPDSVPASPLWDENNPLTVYSTSMPLSARSNYGYLSMTPDRPSTSAHNKIHHRPHTGRNTVLNTSALNSRKKSRNKSGRLNTTLPSSRSQRTTNGQIPNYTQSEISVLPKSPLNFQRDLFAETYSKSDTDLLNGSDMMAETFDHTVNEISSEIDVILNGIHSGMILTSPSLEGTLKQSTNFDELNSTDEKLSHEEKAIDIEMSSNQCNSTDEVLTSLNHEKYEEAAVTIQRWYRQRIRLKEKLRLEGLLQQKKNELNRSRNEEVQRAVSKYELEQQEEEEKQRRRAVKMQAARKVAIENLKKKREEKKNEREKIVQEEMQIQEAKAKKKTSSKTTKTKPVIVATFTGPQSVEQSQSETNCNHPHTETTEQIISEGKHSGANEKDKKTPVDEFFEAGPKKPPSPSPKRKQSSPCSPNHPTTKQTNSTMDDIFATLKELEEEHPPLPGVETTSPTSISYLSTANLQKLQNQPMPRLTDLKLQSILSYLDDVQKTETDSSDVNATRKSQLTEKCRDVSGDARVQEDLSQQLEAASAVANDVTTTIVTLRMEIENKNKTVEMLQKALSQQRELTVYHAKEMEKEAQKRLELQRDEYETTINRHQCFIDQLIDDKKALSDKCEQLLKEIKDMDKRYKTRIKTMEDVHAAEFEKQKQTSIATDKLRRERWRTEETQRIKEATVKSLEPEIQRIIARGKTEIQKLKAMHEAELLQADERASRRFLQQTEELRGQLAQEKEMSCQHERELARQKYEQLAEQEEQSYQQLRRKLYSELQQERDKLAAETQGHRDAIEKQLRELKDTHASDVMRLKQQYESSNEGIHRRHTSELKDLQERLSIERQAWEENYIKKQDAILLSREREMKERLRRERDMEIETVIHKLEEETATIREECERTAEARVKRIREKYETELKEVERSERNTLEKFNSMKTQLTEFEGDVIRLRSQLKQKEEEISRVNEIATRLTRERDRVADVVRQEFVDRLVSLEEENRHVKLEMSELKSRHSLELNRMERDKERELEEVHHRVKQALAKKEDNHRSLRSQHEAALKRADHLEMLLEQQRKELLKR